MKLLLALLLATFLLSVFSVRRGRAPRTWPLVLACLLVSAMFLNFRVV